MRAPVLNESRLAPSGQPGFYVSLSNASFTSSSFSADPLRRFLDLSRFSNRPLALVVDNSVLSLRIEDCVRDR